MDLFNIKMQDLYEGQLAEPIEFLDKIFNEASFKYFFVEVLVIALIIAFINSIIAFCVCKKKLDGFIVFFVNIITKFNTILLIRFLFLILFINKYLSEWFWSTAIKIHQVTIIGCLIIVILFALDMIIEGAIYRRLFIKGEKDGWEISKICNAIANVIVVISPIIVDYHIQSIIHPKNRIASLFGRVYVYDFYFKDGFFLILRKMKFVILLSLIISIIAMLFRMKKKDICVIAIISLIVNTFVLSGILTLDADIEISELFFERYSSVGNIIYLGLLLVSVWFCATEIETLWCKRIIECKKNILPIIFGLTNIIGCIGIFTINVLDYLL